MNYLMMAPVDTHAQACFMEALELDEDELNGRL